MSEEALCSVLQKQVRRPFLGSNLFPDKTSHKNKHLCKTLFSNDIFISELCQAKVLMVFAHYLLPKENELVFDNFIAVAIVDNHFDNPVLFKNVEKVFLLIS